MKIKELLLPAILFATHAAGLNAQTNTFPGSGDAGIGTTAPTHGLTLSSATTGIAIYKTANQTTNYERALMSWNNNIFNIQTFNGGSGSQRSIKIGANDVNTYTINYSGTPKHDWMLSSSLSGQTGYNFGGNFTQSSGKGYVNAITPAISQTGSAGYTALLINPTENSTGSGSKYLIDAQTGGTSRFTVASSGDTYFAGNVGVGTTSPATLFHVRSPVNLGSSSGDLLELARFSGAVNNNGQIRVQLMRFASGTDWTTASTRLQYVTDATSQGYLEFNPEGSAAAIAIGSGSSEIIRFKSNGNVLIGKTSQSTGYKLDVAGSVRANKVVVNTTGADYVFDSSYNLMPLDEVESFIKTNHHLPQIAPAADMQANGIDLGNNQTKLLQKTEELTLYLIEQNRKIQQLTEDNNELKQQLSQIDALKIVIARQQEAIEQLQSNR